LALLTTVLQDHENINGRFWLSVRQSYAAALIRLVNGLVDPLQQGPYARSIASIAAQLGLPAWLVELRHAATHEDLPSLELLREAAKESLTWLLHHYFLPTINPFIEAAPRSQPLRPLSPIFKQYKVLRKQTLRDSTLIARHNTEITAVLREIERWISEAMVASNLQSNGLEWADEEGSYLEEAEPQETWALERLCDALLEEGGLVPLSKKKRLLSEDDFLPPEFSTSLWSPLLSDIQSHHSSFPRVLVSSIIKELLPLEDVSPPSSSQDSASYRSDSQYLACLSRWALWIAQNDWPASSDSSLDLQHNTLVTLMTAQGPARQSKSPGHKAARALLRELTKLRPEYKTLVETLTVPTKMNGANSWAAEDLNIMSQRLETLNTPKEEGLMNAFPIDKAIPDLVPNLPGWRLLTSRDWKPCPIGVYYQEMQ
jgi:ribosomal biogenesis protein LAS1